MKAFLYARIWYRIPILGMIVAAITYVRANRAYWKVADKGPSFPEYNAAYKATCDAFERTFEAFFCTVGLLIIVQIGLAVLTFMERR